MRIGLGYIYKFYELMESGREYFLISSFGQDLVLYEEIVTPDGKALQKREIVVLEISKYEGMGNFTFAGFTPADDYHLWYMTGLTFLNLHEKKFMLMEQETEDIPKRTVIVRRVPA